MKEKIKLTFLRLLENPLLKYLIFKKIFACYECFGLFIKIKKEYGTSFWCTFSAWFFKKKCSLFNTLSMDKVCHTFFPSDDIKQNLLLSYFDNWWHHKLLRFIFDHLLKQWPTERKTGEGNTKIWISREWKELFRWNKKLFKGLSIGGKIKFDKK